MLEIIYQDEYLVAINKPAGLLVHRSPIDRHETRFALQMLRDQIGQMVWPAHRLDKGTSGVLLFALDAHTARLIGQAFEQGTGIQKTYQAMVRGWPAPEGLIDHPLKRMPDDMRTQREEIQAAFRHKLPLGTLLRHRRREGHARHPLSPHQDRQPVAKLIPRKAVVERELWQAPLLPDALPVVEVLPFPATQTEHQFRYGR